MSAFKIKNVISDLLMFERKYNKHEEQKTAQSSHLITKNTGWISHF